MSIRIYFKIHSSLLTDILGLGHPGIIRQVDHDPNL